MLKDTQIIASEVTTTAYVAGDNKQKVNVQLKDADGNVLSGKEINIVVNGKIYEEKTDENGKVALDLTISKVGTYDYVVCFAGDKNYKPSIATSKVIVNKKATKLVLPKKATYKAKAKTKTYSVTLKDAKNKVLAKKQVIIIIKNKTYKATTNSKGVAKINVKLTKKGTYKANVSFKGDSIYNNVSKTGKIIIK